MSSTGPIHRNWVVPYIGTWIETEGKVYDENWNESYLI